MVPRTGSLHSGLEAAPAVLARPSSGRAHAAPRIVARPLAPRVEDGYAACAVAGQQVEVEAEIFMDGHDQLAACLTVLLNGVELESLAMHAAGNDRWRAQFTPARPGRYDLRIDAWLDLWGSFRDALQKRCDARLPLAQDIADGRALIQAALRRSAGPDRQALAALEQDSRGGDEPAQAALLLSETTAAVMARVGGRPFETRAEPELPLEVEREAAGFAAWYELFPRSLAITPGQHGTLDDVIGRLPAIRAMGFDVVYMPPIHPIGLTHRKGPNNSLLALADDPGSPCQLAPGIDPLQITPAELTDRLGHLFHFDQVGANPDLKQFFSRLSGHESNPWRSTHLPVSAACKPSWPRAVVP